MANPICLRLLVHWSLAADSRTFWTAGSSSPIRTAMMAITTSSSMSVKAVRRRETVYMRVHSPSDEDDHRTRREVGPFASASGQDERGTTRNHPFLGGGSVKSSWGRGGLVCPHSA